MAKPILHFLLDYVWIPVLAFNYYFYKLKGKDIVLMNSKRLPWPVWPTVTVSASIYIITDSFYLNHPEYQSKFWTLVPSLAGPILQILAGLIGGLWAVWQFNRTHDQRDQQFIDQQKLAQTHFDLNAREKEFGDIQDRLSSPDQAIRANAALRLAQFGRTLKPGLIDGSLRTDANNPYFLPASQQLITALTLERDPIIREAIKQGIERMIEFAAAQKGSGDDQQPLLYAIVKLLVDSNKKTKDAFIRCWAGFQVAQNQSHGRTEWDVTEQDFKLIACLAPFCMTQNSTISALKSLKSNKIFGSSNLYEASMNVIDGIYVMLRSSESELRIRNSEAIPNLETVARQLIDIRDSLAKALCSLYPPEKVKVVRDKSRSTKLNISSAFLAGANLRAANLQGSSMATVHLEGALLTSARFERAVLNAAHLENSILTWANLAEANLCGANLVGAYVFGSNFEGANLDLANLYGVLQNGPNSVYEEPTVFPVDTIDLAKFIPDSEANRTPELDVRTEKLRKHLEDKVNLQRLIDEYHRRKAEAKE